MYFMEGKFNLSVRRNIIILFRILDLLRNNAILSPVERG